MIGPIRYFRGCPRRTLNPANDTVLAGYYAATTLSAVDADLAVGNIKNGVTIFGFLGTYTGALAQDILGNALTGLSSAAAGSAIETTENIGGNSDYDVATLTQSYASNSLAVGVGFCSVSDLGYNYGKLRLYMNGVQVAESGYFPWIPCSPTILMATRALTGSKICKISVHNYNASTRTFYFTGVRNTGVDSPMCAAIMVGSVGVS